MGNSHSISSHSAFDFAQKGDTRSLQTLLQEAQRRPGTVDLRSYVEHRDPRGLTPLMAAAAGGYVETVRLVLFIRTRPAHDAWPCSAPSVKVTLHLIGTLVSMRSFSGTELRCMRLAQHRR